MMGEINKNSVDSRLKIQVAKNKETKNKKTNKLLEL